MQFFQPLSKIKSHELVHGSVKLVQEPVAEVAVVSQVPLSPGVVVRAVVSGPRKVEPLGMAWNGWLH